MHRFYVPDSLDPETIELTGDESAHMLRVLRLTAGERVILFDGRGHSAIAEITEVHKRSARLQILERLPAGNRTGPEITLIAAVPKSDRFRWLVEKATELGVKRLIPVRTERSVVHPGDGKLNKMEAACIAACKQCGRNDLLTIEPLQDWVEVMQRTTPARLLVADPRGRPLRDVLTATDGVSELMLAVGPEGGFTSAEIELSEDAGAEIVQLGRSVLRIETAALALVAWARLGFC